MDIIFDLKDNGDGTYTLKKVIDKSITTATIPENVTCIENEAFSGCVNLKTVNWNARNCIKAGNVFYAIFGKCDNLTSVNIGDNVLSIPDFAFSECRSLKNVVIGNSVTKIGDSAFSGCSSLENILIPDSVTNIDWFAFSRCGSLKSIVIGKGVTKLADDAFNYCGALESIEVKEGNLYYHSEGNCLIKTDTKKLLSGCNTSVIPTDGSVTSIRELAFLECKGLKSINIPASVTSIGNLAFLDCNGLIDINVSKDNPVYKSDNGCLLSKDGKVLIRGTIEGHIPDSVDTIYDCAFAGCSSLTSISIPDRVTMLGEAAFENCSGLTSVVIGNGVTSIENCTFSGCSSLTNITFPKDLTKIGEEVFSDCANLTSITVSDSVTKIDNGAFKGCTRLTSISIPAACTIGLDAFPAGCTIIRRRI